MALEVMADGVLLSDVGDDFQMPVQVLNTTSLWLIGKQDQRTGRFLEEGTVHNRIYAVSNLNNRIVQAAMPEEHIEQYCSSTIKKGITQVWCSDIQSYNIVRGTAIVGYSHRCTVS